MGTRLVHSFVGPGHREGTVSRVQRRGLGSVRKQAEVEYQETMALGSGDCCRAGTSLLL